MHDALLGGAVDLRVELGNELRGLIGLARLGEGADFLLGGANGSDLDTVAGTAAHGGAGLLGGGSGIGHKSRSDCGKCRWMSTPEGKRIIVLPK